MRSFAEPRHDRSATDRDRPHCRQRRLRHRLRQSPAVRHRLRGDASDPTNRGRIDTRQLRQRPARNAVEPPRTHPGGLAARYARTNGPITATTSVWPSERAAARNEGRSRYRGQLLKVGRPLAGTIVTVVVEDNYYRVLDGTNELGVHARISAKPIRNFNAHPAPKRVTMSRRQSVKRVPSPYR
ncbi:hypothetical protein CH263_22570 [Rhodococcus sp. 06-1059B-a]|nr:hypothetical protein CH263_22570 [Rhodococcus sp. 06-1059B-a]